MLRARLSAVLTVTMAAVLVPLAGAGAHEGHGEHEAQQFQTHQVDTVDNDFIPEDITITAGDTINWVAPATNEEEHTMHEDNDRFDGHVWPGETFTHRFTAAGVYTYHCDIHPTEMAGTVLVQQLDPPVPPEAPRDVTAAAGDGSAVVSWSPPEFNGGSTVTGYTVTAEPGGQTVTVTGTTATVDDLTNDTSYTFEVRATNAAGTGPPATSNAVTPTEGAGPGPGPGEGPCPEDTAPAPFDDRNAIPAAHRLNVDCAAGQGIIAGFPDGTYRPTASVRRDQMASFIARSLAASGVELPAPTGERFTDVTPGSAHDESIHRLAAAGIVQGGAGGLPATSYGTNLGVRRDQMASFLLRAASFAADQQLGSQTQAFPDVASNNPHFANVNGASQVGLAAGFGDGTYRPGAGVRRDQMGTFVVRLLGYLHDNS